MRHRKHTAISSCLTSLTKYHALLWVAQLTFGGVGRACCPICARLGREGKPSVERGKTNVATKLSGHLEVDPALVFRRWRLFCLVCLEGKSPCSAARLLFNVTYVMTCITGGATHAFFAHVLLVRVCRSLTPERSMDRPCSLHEQRRSLESMPAS